MAKQDRPPKQNAVSAQSAGTGGAAASHQDESESSSSHETIEEEHRVKRVKGRQDDRSSRRTGFVVFASFAIVLGAVFVVSAFYPDVWKAVSAKLREAENNPDAESESAKRIEDLAAETSLNAKLESLEQGVSETQLKLQTVVERVDGINDLLQSVSRQLSPKTSVQSPLPPAVFVVLPEKRATADDLRAGFDKAYPGQDIWEVGGSKVKICYVQEGPTADDTRMNMVALSAQYECVLVVGHETSSMAVPQCLQYYVPQGMPAVLLGPTNPSITKQAAERRVKLFLRILPTDKAQAESVSDTLLNEGRERIGIIADLDNGTYSKYLVDELLSNDEVAGRVIWCCGTTTSTISHLGLMLQHYEAPDAIVVLGMTNTAKMVLTQLALAMKRDGSSIDPKSLSLIFSDGCATREFRDFVVHWSRKNQVSPEVLIVSPMPPHKDGRHEFDYEPLGQVGALLARQLLGDALRDSQELSRKSVRWAVERAIDRQNYALSDRSIAAQLPSALQTFDFRGIRTDGVLLYPGDNSRLTFFLYKLRHESGTFATDAR